MSTAAVSITDWLLRTESHFTVKPRDQLPVEISVMISGCTDGKMRKEASTNGLL